MGVEIREAERDDAEFIAWVMLTAFRSHLQHGLWDLVVGDDEEKTLGFLTLLAATEEAHWAHLSTFLIAEVDGERAAALGGYFDEELGMGPLARAIPGVNEEMGRSEAEVLEGARRAASIRLVAPDHSPGAWIIENVATRPPFRRRGLVDRLLAEILQRGRERGAEVADVGVLIGNTSAQLAYEKHGFKVIGEKRHLDFEAAYGSPGIRSLTLNLEERSASLA